MRKVICCWLDRTHEELEKHVPLLFSGKRNLELGFENGIDILFLDGYRLLAQEYKRQLQEVGYRLHDAAALYRQLSERYCRLDAFGDYEKKCFLRWLVLDAVFDGEPLLHFDGDIVFNECPEKISRLLAGRTFLMQGCPAVTAVSDRNWFRSYRAELDRFHPDIDRYSKEAWDRITGWELSARQKWAGQRFREIISSDQDLLSHLIHTDAIPQDSPDQIREELASYLLFENPLYMHGYENDLHGAKYRRLAGIDYVDDRQILVWHMQGYFTTYLSKFLFRKNYLRRGLKRLTNDNERKDFESYLHEFFIRRLNGKTNVRLNLYKYFFEDHDFREILTDRTWWQEGAFSR